MDGRGVERLLSPPLRPALPPRARMALLAGGPVFDTGRRPSIRPTLAGIDPAPLAEPTLDAAMPAEPGHAESPPLRRLESAALRGPPVRSPPPPMRAEPAARGRDRDLPPASSPHGAPPPQRPELASRPSQPGNRADAPSPLKTAGPLRIVRKKKVRVVERRVVERRKKKTILKERNITSPRVERAPTPTPRPPAVSPAGPPRATASLPSSVTAPTPRATAPAAVTPRPDALARARPPTKSDASVTPTSPATARERPAAPASASATDRRVGRLPALAGDVATRPPVRPAAATVLPAAQPAPRPGAAMRADHLPREAPPQISVEIGRIDIVTKSSPQSRPKARVSSRRARAHAIAAPTLRTRP